MQLDPGEGAGSARRGVDSCRTAAEFWYTQTMARPKGPEETTPVHTRLTTSQHAGFREYIRRQQEQIRHTGVQLTEAAALRGMVLRCLDLEQIPHSSAQQSLGFAGAATTSTPTTSTAVPDVAPPDAAAGDTASRDAAPLREAPPADVDEAPASPAAPPAEAPAKARTVKGAKAPAARPKGAAPSTEARTVKGAKAPAAKPKSAKKEPATPTPAKVVAKPAKRGR